MALRDRAQRTDARSDEPDLVGHYRDRLLEEVNLDDLARLNPTQRRARLERILATLLTIEGPVLATRERSMLIQRVVDDALGLGVLEPLLADESITEIMVNGPKDIFVERRGRVERVATTFSSTEHLYQTIDRIVSTVNRRVDESSPMVDARLPTGERVNVIIPPLALDGPTLTIRRFPTPFRLSDLVAKGTLDEHLAVLLAGLNSRPGLAATVVVTHHVEEIAPGTTHALVLRGGRVVASGDAGSTVTGPVLSEAFGLQLDVQRAGDRFTARAASVL